MKKIKYLAFFFVMLISFASSISATTMVYVSGTMAYFFPSVSGVKVRTDIALRGQNFQLLGTYPAGNECSKEWYRVKFNGSEGYICSEWAEKYEVATSYEDGFKATLDTFPKSYWPYIISLHAKYPNATFEARHNNIEWSTALYYQTNDVSMVNGNFNRRSLFQLATYNAVGSHLSQYILDTNTNNAGGGCDGGYCWYAASEKAVSLYMDPRNFLNPRFVFMFETNEYDSSIQNKTGVQNIISNSFMSTNHANYSQYAIKDAENNDLPYADVIMNASVSSNISPYVLAARILQEIGSNGGAMISGAVSGYENLYNYYNIGAGGDNPLANGLTFARDKGWNTRVNSIIGGANYIGTNYKGTEYSQKFDNEGTDFVNYSDFFRTQYMQNVQAPAYQTNTIYNSYLNENKLNLPFKFIIPIYKNMPNEATTISSAIEKSGYVYNEEYVGGVRVGSTVNTVLSNINLNNGDLTVTIKKKDGVTSMSGSERLSTGDIITISDGTTTETLRMLIYGDVNGDGYVTSSDYVLIKNSIMTSNKLTGYNALAADVTRQYGVDSGDYVNIKNYIMGGYTLVK